MNKYLFSLTFGCAICLEPTLAFGQTTPTTNSSVSGASISGTVTYQSAANVITTISGQITLPQNLYYSGGATITYQSSGTPGTSSFIPTGLTLTPDSNSIQVVNTSSSIPAITANALQNAFTNNDLPKAISIIRAAGGANGLE